jgi:hypothetical protein
MNTGYTLLMTACIDPSANKDLYRSNFRLDVSTRLKDYETALIYWLNYNEPQLKSIVFIDNSNFDLTSLKNIVSKHNIKHIEVEFLQTTATPLKPGMHYGYSELEMIDYAFVNSKLLKQTDYFIKVTGRLYFPKLSKLLKRLPSNLKIAIDSRDYELGKYKKHYLVTTVFIVANCFYNNIMLNAKSTMLTGNNGHAEKAYYKILKPIFLSKTGGVILRLPFSMHPVGVGAHWNNDYNSWKNKLISNLRDASRILLPNFWV